MKKLIIAWIALLLVTATFAQQSEQEKAFLEKAVKMEKQLNAVNDSKVKEQLLIEYIAFNCFSILTAFSRNAFSCSDC